MSTTEQFFDGQIDNIKKQNRALTDDEIKQRYNEHPTLGSLAAQEIDLDYIFSSVSINTEPLVKDCETLLAIEEEL